MQIRSKTTGKMIGQLEITDGRITWQRWYDDAEGVKENAHLYAEAFNAGMHQAALRAAGK